jgi:DNA-directed RNA polymerase specialized sigma24 family protein
VLAAATSEPEIYDWTREPPIPRRVYAETIHPHKVLQEVLRHFIQLHAYVAQGNSPEITNTYLIAGAGVPDECPSSPWAERPREHRSIEMRCVFCRGAMRRVTATVNFWDLTHALMTLDHPRREAVFHNVILDRDQHAAGRTIGIATATVARRVNQGLRQLANVVDVEIAA